MKPDTMSLSVKTELQCLPNVFQIHDSHGESQGFRTYDFSTFYKNTATKTRININAMLTIY